MNSKSWLVTMVDERGIEQCGSFKNIEIDGRLNETSAREVAAEYTKREKMSGYIIKKGGRWSDLQGMKPTFIEEVK